MIRVAILGAGGRMGRLLVQHVLADARFRLAAAVERPGHPWEGRDIGLAVGAGEVGVCVRSDLSAVLAETEVAVDFSDHRAVVSHAAGCRERGVAWVLGTTGLTPEETEAVRAAAAHIPVVWSANMSPGMNVLFRLVRQAAALLKEGYDIEIVEMHHRHKKDAPSGTALALGRAAAEGRGWSLDAVACHGRKGETGERPVEAIGFHALRGGDVAGDHTVILAGEGERVELTHRASSREAFVQGALRAAAWVVERPSGLYEMADVLGLR
jgi:4-hydroxy-tetrahydrodipicolinate reductase